MLKDHSQLQLSLSPYQGLYDAIIPEDHLLRRIKENIDFSFVNPMLRKQYCENFGRPAKEPEMMFKLLFLKKLYDLSDAKAKDKITKIDKQRASYYNYYTSKRWGEVDSYDLCLNSSVFGIDGTVDMIKQAIEVKDCLLYTSDAADEL